MSSGFSLSPFDIQSHLYSSFIQGSTADVALRVSGRWHAVYQLHRVVLIQSDFFRSLFTSDFREASQSHARSRGAGQIDIIFDDTNITRAAFEICLSRLYGGGPSLHLPESLVPSTSQPLSPSFTTGLCSELIPNGSHPATPRFLLSLLATSIYLSIPTVASQALSLIFKTINPYTVIHYLNFALGRSIDYTPPLWADPDAAAGLEGVAEILEHEFPITSTPVSADEELSGMTSKVSTISIDGGLSEVFEGSRSSDSSHDESGTSSHHYGAISDKIGEACACWLVRWASDLLTLEQRDEGAPERPIKALEHPQGYYSLEVASTYGPLVWRRGGLDASWVSALVSADAFFVKNERARYDFARAVVELRRSHGISPSEERHWRTMFDTGIYYANMSVEDIIAISSDVSSTTHEPYVPMQVLQTALWSQSLLRHQITYRPPGLPGQTPSPPPRDKELGIAVLTTDLKNSPAKGNVHEVYYPVLSDSSVRLGDNGNDPQGSSDGSVSMEDLFKFSHSPVPYARQSTNKSGSSHKVSVQSDVRLSCSEETFFGLRGERYSISECLAVDPAGKRRFTPFPPARFGVEFWDIDTLKEKSRLHSQTIWHAGSLFNIYIQIVKKKGQTQLGIYLHRQSTIEPIPSPSAPYPSFSKALSEEGSFNKTEAPSGVSISARSPVIGPPFAGMALASPTLHSSHSLIGTGLGRINTPSSASPPSSPLSSMPGNHGSQSFTSIPLPYTSIPTTPTQPYRDPRSAISAYFSISCPSATGSSHMRFTSAPDVFSVSQSWGWKTSALRTEEYMEIVNENGAEPVLRSSIKSLRATVVLGLT
ncbi:hypothetical protein FA15DRAFT_629940 [Coprinopsis marcescibilis]|uniref:BTB domain-containing protein n=1 Tax=Coprinopsis marcescibilis TaxID=230819 RepID=A0A5C3LDG3_COPMA|nr:hypothetical protein FA15DRAFT_629940 [Coprinopsis marcescibilis]